MLMKRENNRSIGKKTSNDKNNIQVVKEDRHYIKVDSINGKGDNCIFL